MLRAITVMFFYVCESTSSFCLFPPLCNMSQSSCSIQTDLGNFVCCHKWRNAFLTVSCVSCAADCNYRHWNLKAEVQELFLLAAVYGLKACFKLLLHGIGWQMVLFYPLRNCIHFVIGRVIRKKLKPQKTLRLILNHEWCRL